MRRYLLIFTALLLAGSLAAAQGPAPGFGPFVPFGQLQVQLDGRVLEGMEMFYSDRPAAYLLRAPGLEQPLLINVRSQQVEQLNATAVRQQANGTVELLAGAVVAAVGGFEVAGNELKASLDDGRQLLMVPKPELLGPRTAAELVAHDASYGYRAGLYPPSSKAIAELRKEPRQVTVEVYFGSWCSACSRVVPWLLAVEKALAGSNISFEYYGLPGTLDDPVAHQAGVKAVPTAVVSAGDEELGRRNSTGLGIPEEALLEILSGG